jgi:hypothetical protein
MNPWLFMLFLMLHLEKSLREKPNETNCNCIRLKSGYNEQRWLLDREILMWYYKLIIKYERN